MRCDWKEGTLEGVRLRAKTRATKVKAQKAVGKLEEQKERPQGLSRVQQSEQMQ